MSDGKIWLSSPTMHGDEIKYMQKAYDTNWMSTVGENINEVFTPDEVGRITKMKIGRMLLSENGREVFEESVAALKKAVSAQKAKESGNSFDALRKLISEKAGNTDM